MQKRLVILSGISYGYCNHMVFNKIIGFLDEEQDIIVGVELNDEECNVNKIEDIKKHLLEGKKSVRYICGTMTDRFEYYGVDFGKERIHYGRMRKRSNGEMSGNVKVLQDGKQPIVIDDFYVSCSAIETVEDEELRTVLTHSLEKQKQNFAWRGFLYAVEAKAMNQNPRNKILFKAVPSER